VSQSIRIQVGCFGILPINIFAKCKKGENIRAHPAVQIGYSCFVLRVESMKRMRRGSASGRNKGEANSTAAVIYPYVPHYRIPVFRELLSADMMSGRQFVLFASRNSIELSIRSDDGAAKVAYTKLPIFTLLGLTFQFGLFRVVCGSRFRHLIFLGDPHFITTWMYAILGRLSGKHVWFWSHGWLRSEAGIKKMIRGLFYRLASGLLLYGRRAKEIGIAMGFRSDRLHVIYNSLDYESQCAVREAIEAGLVEVDYHFEQRNWRQAGPYFSCVARLTPACRFDIAIEAIFLLNTRENLNIGMVFVGDGQERRHLEDLARQRNVRCWFVGELYEEKKIGPIIYGSRAVVSPGKVGLTAMHSLAYGTPVISHNDFDRQMPEYEAIVPGKTGDFFNSGDAADLATVLGRWLSKPRDDAERKQCYRAIEESYTPKRQRDLIEAALRTVENA
jgi:glycosyltransferase involved in cell wall biosynthesis